MNPTGARFDAFDAFDLPTIDLTATDARDVLAVPLDRRTYEERFAELGFGLGVAPRRQRRDDAWWETPIGLMAMIVGLLVLLALAAGTH